MVSKSILFRGPINDRISHGIDNKLKLSTQIVTFSSAKTGLNGSKQYKSPLKLD